MKRAKFFIAVMLLFAMAALSSCTKDKNTPVPSVNTIQKTTKMDSGGEDNPIPPPPPKP